MIVRGLCLFYGKGVRLYGFCLVSWSAGMLGRVDDFDDGSILMANRLMINVFGTEYINA